MFVNAKKMLQDAKAGKYAVAQININNLEWTKAALLTAEAQKSPIILGVTGGAAKYMGSFKVVASMARALDESLKISVPVCIHLDHGSYEQCLECIEAGFTSIMFDGSHFPFDENKKRTSEMVALAKKHNMTLEAEIGAIGGEEDGVTGSGEIADPAQCKEIADLGVDFLAAGIGNIHGVYPDNWAGLAFDTLEKISNLLGPLPLVLHGGTGIPEDMIKRAISLGVAKINVNTECQLAFAKATREYVEAGLDKKGKGFDPRKLLAPGAEAIAQVVKEKFVLFGSVGKA